VFGWKKEPMTQGASTRGVISVPGGETEKNELRLPLWRGARRKGCAGVQIFAGITVRFFTKLVVVIHPARKRGLARVQVSSQFSGKKVVVRLQPGLVVLVHLGAMVVGLCCALWLYRNLPCAPSCGKMRTNDLRAGALVSSAPGVT
jgi:hypothetical protein